MRSTYLCFSTSKNNNISKISLVFKEPGSHVREISTNCSHRRCSCCISRHCDRTCSCWAQQRTLSQSTARPSNLEIASCMPRPSDYKELEKLPNCRWYFSLRNHLTPLAQLFKMSHSTLSSREYIESPVILLSQRWDIVRECAWRNERAKNWKTYEQKILKENGFIAGYKKEVMKILDCTK